MGFTEHLLYLVVTYPWSQWGGGRSRHVRCNHQHGPTPGAGSVLRDWEGAVRWKCQAA